MPSIQYINNSAPFWDFVARLEEQGTQHPLFGGRQQDDSNAQEPQNWGPWGQVPFRGRHGPHPHPPPPAPAHDDEPMNSDDPPEDPNHPDAGPSEPRGPPRHGGGPRRGPWARRGGCYGRGQRAFPYHHGPPPYAWADYLRSQIFGEQDSQDAAPADFKPDADIFDTPEAFVIHVSLPGAKKDDVGVHWDADKSELAIAGVVYRPGDEDFLKTLALNERSIGPFEKKIRLGSRANPAQVDADAITAKMDDGVLTIEVPKLDSGYVEVKKVDIE